MIHKRCEYVHDDPEWQCIKALGHLGEHDYQGKTDWRSEPSAPASAEPSNAPTTREWLVAQLAKSRDWGYGALSIEGVTKLLDAYTADLRAKLEQVERDLLERTTQRNLARDAREVWSKRAETAESALADAQARIRVLEGERDAALKDAKSWKHEFEMYRNAWVRELGGWLIPKAHDIDSLVLTTRKRVVNPLLGNCRTPHWLDEPTEDRKALKQTPHPMNHEC